jgi:dihydrofolate reductase
MKVNLIVAMCRNNGIGYAGQIPWHIKTDLHYFAKLTKGAGKNAVVMGSNTWQSLPQGGGGLKGRDNLVLSARKQFDLLHHDHTMKTFKTLAELDQFIGYQSYEEIWVIGGAQIYQQFLELDRINKCYITYIDRAFECDAFFPAIDLMPRWREVEKTSIYDKTYDCQVDFLVYKYIDENDEAAHNEAAHNEAAHNEAEHNEAKHNEAEHNEAKHDEAEHVAEEKGSTPPQDF